MTDSIHPENEDIIQNVNEDDAQIENEELNNSDISDSAKIIDENETSSDDEEFSDAYQDDQIAYDDCEDNEECSHETNEASADAEFEDDAESDVDAAEEYGADDDMASISTNSFLSKLTFGLKKAIDAFSKLDKKKRNKYIIIASAVAILLFLVLTDLIPILPNSYNRSYVGNQYTIIDNGHSVSANYRKGVIYANDGFVMCFGPDMDLLSRIDTFSGSPFIRTNGNGAVVYSKGSNKALVMTSEKNQKIVETEEEIISASINSKGDYVLVTKEAGYTACVSAFDYESKAIYKWHTGNNILDTAISPNGQSIVASGIEQSDTQIYSKLIFLDVASKDPVMQIDLDSNLAVELVFLDKNTVVAIGDSYATAYTPSGNQKWRIDYDAKLLKTYDISDDGTMAFLFNRYNSALSESFVETYNTRGKKIGSYLSNENVRNISINNKHCLLVLDDSTILVDYDGDVKKTKKLNKEYSSLQLYQNYNFAFGISNGVVEVVSVRH